MATGASAMGGRADRVLARLSEALALGGAALMVAVLVLATVSVTARTVLGKPVPGDFELLERATAVAAAWFLPYAERVRAHVLVDFFTSALGPRSAARLEGAGLVLVAPLLALIAVTTAQGALGLWRSGEVSMNLGIPQFLPVALMVPGIALFAINVLVHGVQRLARPDREIGDERP